MAARPPQQLPVPPSPQQPGRPQLQRPLAVPRLPLGPSRLQQRTAGWVHSFQNQEAFNWNFYQLAENCVCFFFWSDLTNAATFRDLSKPVGALNKERLERLLVRTDPLDVWWRSWTLQRPFSFPPSSPFTGPVPSDARPAFHVRQPLLISGLRSVLPGQSRYVDTGTPWLERAGIFMSSKSEKLEFQYTKN